MGVKPIIVGRTHQWAVLASLSWVCVLLGSVTAENCAELARQPDVDGFIEAVTHQWAVLVSLSCVCVARFSDG